MTSGFDGSIYTWDINHYSENEPPNDRIFYTNGLMRMRLTQDWNKIVISTMNNYLMIVHDLDLDKMAKDLEFFKVNLVSLKMHLSNSCPQSMRATLRVEVLKSSISAKNVYLSPILLKR